MSILTILTLPDPRLGLPATTVTDIASVQPLIDDMLETLYATSNGVGLAASQVGRREAVVVIDISEERNQPLILLNPEVIAGERSAMGEEGCLSVPDYYAEVERFTKVRVKAQDRHGQPLMLEQDGFLARVLLHEIDHLKGNLFISYLSPLKRQMALKKVKKSVARNR